MVGNPVWPQRPALCLARRCVQLDRLLARALAGARVGTGALATDRQAAPMAHATVRAQVHEALDVHGHFAAQVALDREFRELRADGADFGLRQVLDLGGRVDARRLTEELRACATDAIDV